MQRTMEKAGLKIDNATPLAAERNRQALERTLIAWVRTAISLITFGYGFYKAGQLLGPTSPVDQAGLGPRQFGLTMILIGISALNLGTREHRAELHQLHREFGTRVPASPRRMLALAVALLGLAAVASMLFRK